MRILGIAAAGVIGLFVGMLAGNAIALMVGAGSGAQEAATGVGALLGAFGLGWWIARLVPAKPSRLRDRGAERMRRR